MKQVQREVPVVTEVTEPLSGEYGSAGALESCREITGLGSPSLLAPSLRCKGSQMAPAQVLENAQKIRLFMLK